MKQKLEHIIMPLPIVGGSITEELEEFIKNNLMSDTFKSLISYIGNKDIVSIEQLEGDLKEKVLKYIEIMKKMEKHLKQSKKSGKVDGIVVDGKSFSDFATENKIQGKNLAGEKNKFYAKYVKILKGELQQLLAKYLSEYDLKTVNDRIAENKKNIEKIEEEKKKINEEIEKEKSKEPISSANS
eukprot:gene12878-7300_t